MSTETIPAECGYVRADDENYYRVRENEFYLSGCKYGPMQEGGKDFLCPHCGGYGTDCDGKCEFCSGTGYIEKNDVGITKVPPEEYVIRLYEEHCEMKMKCSLLDGIQTILI
jgi:hypothetical protein